MNYSRINVSLALILALTVTTVSTTFASAEQNKAISKKELKVLLKTAKEPADHLRIAGYYRQEATRLHQEAKRHEGLAQVYTENPPYAGMVSKHGTSFGLGAPHCRRWAELANQRANESESLAVLHEGMAKDADKK